jgi:hypothetical protein
MKRVCWAIVLATACTSSAAPTGPASVSLDGGAAVTASASMVQQIGDSVQFLDSPQATLAYLPWLISINLAPAGTPCSSEKVAFPLYTVEIAVPYQNGEELTKAADLSVGAMAIQPLSSEQQPLTMPLAQVQVYGQQDLPDILTSGTLTITSFSSEQIAATLSASGSGATSSLSGTFVATRCDYQASEP